MEDLNSIVKFCSKINKGKEVKVEAETAKIIIKWYNANDIELIVRINKGEYFLSKLKTCMS